MSPRRHSKVTRLSSSQQIQPRLRHRVVQQVVGAGADADGREPPDSRGPCNKVDRGVDVGVAVDLIRVAVGIARQPAVAQPGRSRTGTSRSPSVARRRAVRVPNPADAGAGIVPGIGDQHGARIGRAAQRLAQHPHQAPLGTEAHRGFSPRRLLQHRRRERDRTPHRRALGGQLAHPGGDIRPGRLRQPGWNVADPHHGVVAGRRATAWRQRPAGGNARHSRAPGRPRPITSTWRAGAWVLRIRFDLAQRRQRRVRQHHAIQLDPALRLRLAGAADRRQLQLPRIAAPGQHRRQHPPPAAISSRVAAMSAASSAPRRRPASTTRSSPACARSSPPPRHGRWRARPPAGRSRPAGRSSRHCPDIRTADTATPPGPADPPDGAGCDRDQRASRPSAGHSTMPRLGRLRPSTAACSQPRQPPV